MSASPRTNTFRNRFSIHEREFVRQARAWSLALDGKTAQSVQEFQDLMQWAVAGNVSDYYRVPTGF